MCLLKFDYFFLMAFSVQLVLLVPSVSPLERVLTIIALPTTLLLLLIGYYGVRQEIKSVTFLFMLGLLSGSSYFIYKVRHYTTLSLSLSFTYIHIPSSALSHLARPAGP